MSVFIRTVTTKNDKKRFIELPWNLYRDDPYWVPPLRREMWETIDPLYNPLFNCGPHCLFVAEREGQVVGRIMTAIDHKLNQTRNHQWGYFSLFETVNDTEVAALLLGTAEEWLRMHGAAISRGPVSPSNGDDYRGLLIEGFDSPPVLMNSYNPAYYASLIAECGYAGDGNDRLAYYFDTYSATQHRLAPVIEYAKERYKFRVDKANLKNIEKEFADLKTIIDLSMPEWPDMTPPTIDELRLMGKKIVPVADADFILIARNYLDEPIGFLLGLPDYNQVLPYLNGNLFPFGWLKLLLFKKRINGLRIFVLFVIPKYQGKGVSHGLFLEVFKNCLKKGYTWAEGSTIVEQNTAMNRDAVAAGGKLYKRYRTYEKQL